METLLKNSAQFKILTGDRKANRLSHAYMLFFRDAKNLRDALKYFACGFFGAEEGDPLYARIFRETLPDLKVYPEQGKKITADGVSALIEDSALKPTELTKKLYIICGFDEAAPLVQNKLLKTLEEPPEGVHFLLGVTSLAPVLDTVRSRVKILEIPPFTGEQILSALERRGHSGLNAAAAESCGGILGDAENMVEGGWFEEVREAAEKICAATDPEEIAYLAAEYGDTKYKRELLGEMQRQYFYALTSGGGCANKHKRSALIYAAEKISKANADLKFNAYFQALLYDFMLSVIKADEKPHNKN